MLLFFACFLLSSMAGWYPVLLIPNAPHGEGHDAGSIDTDRLWQVHRR